MDAAAKGNRLFTEFEPATAQAWEAAIKASLKGADYEKALFRKSYEGIVTKPFYTRQETETLNLPAPEPGTFPFVRGTQTRQNLWHNCPPLAYKNASYAVQKVREALEKGATAVEITLTNASETGLSDFLAEDFGAATIFLHYSTFPAGLAEQLKAASQNNAGRKTRFVVTYSPFTLANQSENGIALEQFIALHRQAPQNFPVTVNGAEFYNHGGTLVQELAFTLSALTELAHKLTGAGLSADEAFAHVHLRMAVGTNYFFEIAKLRALRLLYAGLVKAFGAGEETAAKLQIQSVTSSWHQTLSDPYNNLLRATTEAMAAVISGTNFLTVLPHSSETGSGGDFSDRIARNISTIIKEEAYLGNAIDPAAGAYYIESVTNQLAEAAWKLFQQTEAQGGFLAVLQNGFILTEIEKAREAKQANLATRKELLIGTNQFANLSDSFSETLLQDLDHAAGNRASTAFDLLRLRTAAFSKQSAHNPKVHLLLLGTSSMRKARADFAQDFFALAGFDAVRVSLANEAEMPPALSDATCIVLCAADEDYAQYLDTIADTLKSTGKCNLVLLAGNPALLPAGLAFNGIDGFIYTGANAVEVLTTVQMRLGIV